MGHCQHFIMANSTFSWWASWLARGYADKVVICPEKWFTAPQFNIKDLYPDSWIRCAV
jgi:hypothetical protein